MRVSHAAPDVRAALASDMDDVARDLTDGMRQVASGLKEELRDQVRAADLGEKLAKTWQGQSYPKTGNSFDPSAFVWSKAPTIVDAFSRGATIVPVNGQRYLAIPSPNVPRRGRRKMTPLDVETEFNQDLIIRREPNGNLLAFVDARVGFKIKGFRALAKGPKAKLVLMFTLVRQVRMRKRLDPDAAAARWTAKVPDLI